MRTAEFDREYVLSSAMNEFIAKGYNKTSMQDLKKATGLHPGSIYCAFENKRGLLIAALNHYAVTKSQIFEQYFVDSECIFDGFEAYLSDIVSHKECMENKACLLQKSLSELDQQDEEVEQLICAMLKNWKADICAKLEQAAKNGEIATNSDCRILGDFMVMSIYGLRAFASTKPSEQSLREMLDMIMKVIRGS